MKGKFFLLLKGVFFFSVWFDPAVNTGFKHSFSFSLIEVHTELMTHFLIGVR